MFMRKNSLSKHSCFRNIVEIPDSALLLQEIRFYKSTSSSGNSFIHSALLRAPIGIEFNFYFKNVQLVIPHLYAPQWTRIPKRNQEHSSRTRILRGRSNKLLENKFYTVYRLIQVSFHRTSYLRKGDVVILTKIEFTFFQLTCFTLK